MTAFRWTPAHIAAIDLVAPVTPLITREMVTPLVPRMDIWDHWPVLEKDGSVACVAGGCLVIALSAPIFDDPEDRHGLARLRLFHRSLAGWRDLGDLFPDGFTPGSREWAGSAILDPTGVMLTVYFTAAGKRGEPSLSFAQRLFASTATFDRDKLQLRDWSALAEIVSPDGRVYQSSLAGGAGTGTIKAFRDPFFWRDPKNGSKYILFAGSSASATSPWNGLVGLARCDDDCWTLCPPLVEATGLNNELERPHLVIFNDRRYLFWSTQQKVFADGGPAGPTGLYGVVADDIAGPWRPLNGSGLVLRNPLDAPFQAYSWQVLADGRVWSFVDMIGLARPPLDANEARAHFGGAPAPLLQLVIEGETTFLR